VALSSDTVNMLLIRMDASDDDFQSRQVVLRQILKPLGTKDDFKPRDMFLKHTLRQLRTLSNGSLLAQYFYLSAWNCPMEITAGLVFFVNRSQLCYRQLFEHGVYFF
jgi:hypothetical protein